MAVFYNNRHDPSRSSRPASPAREDNARISAYVVEIGGDVVEQMIQLAPGKPLEVNLVEVSGSAGRRPPASSTGSKEVTASTTPTSSRCRAVASRSSVPSPDGPRPARSCRAWWGRSCSKFVQTSGDVWVYEGQRSFDYDAFAHGGVRDPPGYRQLAPLAPLQQSPGSPKANRGLPIL